MRLAREGSLFGCDILLPGFAICLRARRSGLWPGRPVTIRSGGPAARVRNPRPQRPVVALGDASLFSRLVWGAVVVRVVDIPSPPWASARNCLCARLSAVWSRVVDCSCGVANRYFRRGGADIAVAPRLFVLDKWLWWAGGVAYRPRSAEWRAEISCSGWTICSPGCVVRCARDRQSQRPAVSH